MAILSLVNYIKSIIIPMMVVIGRSLHMIPIFITRINIFPLVLMIHYYNKYYAIYYNKYYATSIFNIMPFIAEELLNEH